jgi:hypothetical protein
MGKNNTEVSYTLRSEQISVKGLSTDFTTEEVMEANYKLENYFDRVFDTAFREIKKAFPDAICFRNGVKQ